MVEHVYFPPCVVRRCASVRHFDVVEGQRLASDHLVSWPLPTIGTRSPGIADRLVDRPCADQRSPVCPRPSIRGDTSLDLLDDSRSIFAPRVVGRDDDDVAQASATAPMSGRVVRLRSPTTSEDAVMMRRSQAAWPFRAGSQRVVGVRVVDHGPLRRPSTTTPPGSGRAPARAMRGPFRWRRSGLPRTVAVATAQMLNVRPTHRMTSARVTSPRGVFTSKLNPLQRTREEWEEPTGL